MIRLALNFAVIFLVIGTLAHAATVNNKITGAKLSNAVIAKDGYDPCYGKNVGDISDDGTICAGTGFSGLGSYKYMTTPGHCSGFVNNYTGFTPTCTGATDDLAYAWAVNNADPSACYSPTAGTTPCNVTTGVTSTTAGSSNTTTLAANYADTDAASYCENMTYPATNGYTDWYLPSKDELNLVLYAMNAAGKGNFEATIYWSSTERFATSPWNQNFSGGAMQSSNKTASCNIRCVRKY